MSSGDLFVMSTLISWNTGGLEAVKDGGGGMMDRKKGKKVCELRGVPKRQMWGKQNGAEMFRCCGSSF